MNFMWLHTFNIIVEKKSLTKAARALHLTQPAVSKQLRGLELYYGTPLFHRTTREVELTEAGKIVYEHSRRVMEMIQKSREEVQVLTSTVRGELLLGASTIPGEYILPGIIGPFQQCYPEVKVRLEIGDSREVASKVLEGEFELGVTGIFFKNPTLRQELFFEDELVVIVPCKHRFAGRENIGLEEVLEEPMVARESGSGTRTVVEGKFAALGISPAALKIKMEMGSNEAVLNAVAAGHGISLISLLAARPRAQAGKIFYLRIADLPLKRPLYFITRKNRESSVLLKTFLTFVKNNLKQFSQDQQELLK
ncbi:MAG: selenium metabolism-associated LysR family transcriptional regulator [Bacillota bacterium]|nr:selenium metabolism-associated LysR family transcriptional regulator [Bacillota bacterium]